MNTDRIIGIGARARVHLQGEGDWLTFTFFTGHLALIK